MRQPYQGFQLTFSIKMMMASCQDEVLNRTIRLICPWIRLLLIHKANLLIKMHQIGDYSLQPPSTNQPSFCTTSWLHWYSPNWKHLCLFKIWYTVWMNKDKLSSGFKEFPWAFQKVYHALLFVIVFLWILLISALKTIVKEH